MAVEIPYRRDFAFEYGRLEPVAPGVRRIVARNPGPFTFKGTGTYVVGEGEVAVIDPGPDLPDHIAALLASLEGERVTHILVTHTHRDHSPAAQAVKEATGAPTYGFGPHAGGRRGEAGAEEGGDWDFSPDIVVRDGDVIEGGRLAVRGRAHAGPYLEPSVLRAARCGHPVQRRSRHGLVDQRRRAAGRRYGGVYGLARQAAGAARRGLLADSWPRDHRAAASCPRLYRASPRARGRDPRLPEIGRRDRRCNGRAALCRAEPGAAPRGRTLGAGASDRPDRAGHRRRRWAADRRGALSACATRPEAAGQLPGRGRVRFAGQERTLCPVRESSGLPRRWRLGKSTERCYLHSRWSSFPSPGESTWSSQRGFCLLPPC